MLLRDLIPRCAAKFGDDAAFVDSSSRRTWAEMHERSSRLAAALQSFRLEKGQTSAILSRNRVELAEHWFACLKGGTVRAGINFRYSADQMRHAIRDCDARVLFVDASCAEALRDHYDELTAEGRIIVGIGEAHGLLLDYETLLSSSEDTPALPALFDSDPAMIGYTSGTTGAPKGVILNQKNVYVATVYNSLARGYSKDTVRIYVSNPAGINIYAMCVSLVTGMTTILADFDPGRFFDLVEEYRVKTVTLSPTMLRRIVDRVRQGHHDLSSLAQVCYGSMPATPALIREAYATLGCAFQNGYGLSETAGVVTTLMDAEHRRAISGESDLLMSVGKPLLHADVEIRDEAGRPLSADGIGTVWIRSETVMQGYLNLPRETAEVLKGGWLETGDSGRIDSRGYLFLGDRKSNMIISGGFNVYPNVVENALAEHDAVCEVAVFGVPHPDWGEAVVAAVSLHAGARSSAAELGCHCRGRLSAFELPKHIEIIPALPKGNTDKLDKRAVRQMLIDSNSVPWLQKQTQTVGSAI